MGPIARIPEETAPRAVGLLVRVEQGAGLTLAGVRAAEAPLRDLGFAGLERLFAVPAAPGALGAAPQPRAWWFHAPLAAAQASPWDAVHAALAADLGFGAAAGDVFVEPDLEQVYLSTEPAPEGLAAGSKRRPGVADPPDPDLPSGPGFAWHLGADFSELRAAREALAALGPIPPGEWARIAHLDTGYDPEHGTLPANLRRELQRSFIPGEQSRDATDPGIDRPGPLDNPGHGTGTLSILAGNQVAALGDFLGGAPDAPVIPLRIAESVVLLRTSALAKALNHVAEGGPGGARLADVVSLSMGGVASQAWADAVNKAYEAGVCIVAAAGNNVSAGFFGLPTRFVVYPARFRRAIAAGGVMANREPYYGLPAGRMQGNWGPASAMATALAAFTPNMPWAELGAPAIVDHDGAGTSSATPQIAAAAALWLTAHRAALAAKYSEPWQRVEAVRHALFSTADRLAGEAAQEKVGNGVLSAAAALAVAPPDAVALTRRDRAAFAFLRVLTGLGVAPTAGDEMLALEATQLAQQAARNVAAGQPNPFEEIVPDPDLPPETIPPARVRRFLEELVEHPRASRALRARLEEAHQGMFGQPAPAPAPRKKPKRSRGEPAPAPAAPTPTTPPSRDDRLAYATRPAHRSLRAYALEPSLQLRLDTAPVSRVTLQVPWEDLESGPVGEYLEVVDYDPASKCFYEPVDLDDPRLLAQDGLPPSEGTPQFHQQMVYAVAATTIRNFERALGRKVFWSPGPPPPGAHPKNDSTYVQRLRIYPHALRDANAYYSPRRKALLFGYFPASADDPGGHLPGGMVFTCLSHDVIAHETTHALLDGMHRRFIHATNPDVLAFHEAFADVVALFQHFTMREVLRHQIARTRGDLRSHQNVLGEMAGEFGRASGMRQALRSAIGAYHQVDGKPVWRPHEPDPREYQQVFEPHRRGAILVAAIFDAFLSIYETRVRGLLRLATGGSGVLTPGAIPPELVEQLAAAANKATLHVLMMCVRALDYCPPVDITFGEYLRALITADHELVPDDDLHYRVAFVEAFRRRGIYPRDLRTLSVESLLWCGPGRDEHRASPRLLGGLEQLRSWSLQHVHTTDRRELFHLEREMRRRMHGWLREHFASGRHAAADARFLGIDPAQPFEVHALRVAHRVGPDDTLQGQIVIEVLQDRRVPLDPADPGAGTMELQGGCAIVADLQRLQVDYAIRKNALSEGRLARQQEFMARHRAGSLWATYFGGEEREPVARLHRGGG
ncbi:MAG TPA: S8 family serine peptidase [Thermoanaerobaculia bacterium]|nr:S8 family serine peptidase [Thermoanaerobaculia bacterium]